MGMKNPDFDSDFESAVKVAGKIIQKLGIK